MRSAILLGLLVFSASSPVFADGLEVHPDFDNCAINLDPQAHIKGQLEFLMAHEDLAVPDALNRLTKTEWVGLKAYTPLNADVLRGSGELEPAKVGREWLPPIITRDSLEYFYRNASSLLSDDMPRTDRKLWARYYLLNKGSRRLAVSDLLTYTKVLFGDRGPIADLVNDPTSVSLERRTDIFDTLEAFVRAQWDGNRTDKIESVYQLLGPILRGENRDSLAVENAFARDFVAGDCPNPQAVLNFLARELTVTQLVTVIGETKPEGLHRLQTLIDERMKIMKNPKVYRDTQEIASTILASTKDDAVKQVLLSLLRRITDGFQSKTFDDALIAYYSSNRRPETLNSLLNEIDVNEVKSYRIASGILSSVPKTAAEFREIFDLIEAHYRPRNFVKPWLQSDFDTIRDWLVAQLGKQNPPEWDEWALAQGHALAAVGRPEAFADIAKAYFAKYPTEANRAMLVESYRKYEISLADLIIRVFFREQRPSPEELERALAEAQGDEVSRAKIREFTIRTVDAHEGLTRNLQQKYRALLPEIRQKQADLTVDILTNGKNVLVPLVRSQILREQYDVEERLIARQDEFIQKNEPPSGMTWMKFINLLPKSARYQFVKRLLDQHVESRRAVVKTISELEPWDGVREAVNDHLNESRQMQTNRTEFSHDQVKAMFGGDRIRRFFPHVGPKTQVDRGSIRTTFIMATKVGRKGSVGLAWLAEKMHAEELTDGVHTVLGFRPVLGHAQLNNQLGNDLGNLSRIDAPDQARGLVVQGNYEKRGVSMMADNTTQGTVHVEEAAAQLNRRIERSLRQGTLGQLPRIGQRLFVYNWAMNATPSLIEEMRVRAANIAEHYKPFFDLRAEVHNFPNRSTLARVQQFRANYGAEDWVKEQLGVLLGDIEKVLNRSHPSKRNIDETIEELSASDELKTWLKEVVADVWSKDLPTQLQTFALLRDKWFEQRQEWDDDHKVMDSLLGDHTLSDFVQTVLAREIAIIKSPSTPSDLAAYAKVLSGILAHVQRDDLLTERQTQALTSSVQEIANARGLSVEQKRDALLRIIQSAIDQAYQALDVQFGRYDRMLSHILPKPDGNPADPFMDDVLRGSNVFMLNQLAERIHKPIEVFNPGRTVGTLRLNPDVSRLTATDIPVFEFLPPQVDPVAGMLTLAVGSRLSHLQLLARSLGIPNVKVDRTYRDNLRRLDGRQIMLAAHIDGTLEIREADDEGDAIVSSSKAAVVVPKPNHVISKPISLRNAGRRSEKNFAGPKSMQLARLTNDSNLSRMVPEGVILPFGFFARYASETKLRPLLRTLRYTNIENRFLVARLTQMIHRTIDETPIPSEMFAEVLSEMNDMRAQENDGFFVRSDTNVEDLDEFNGAGLNESVPNVKYNVEALDRAIRRVWKSAFTERSIYWRAKATRSMMVVMAEPSVLIQRTVEAASSGVMTSRGTEAWKVGRGMISADGGIASVVEAHAPVEEWTLASGQPLRLAFSTSQQRSVANAAGGVVSTEAESGRPILTRELAGELNQVAISIDRLLGDRPHGWDIEWALTDRNEIRILQARPNF